MSVRIMQTISRQTRFVSGLPSDSGRAGGDPSPKTAWGVFCGIEAAVRAKLGRGDVGGLKVAVQGVGNVGYHLCRYLHEAGASLIVSDIDAARVQRACDEFGSKPVPLGEILYQDVDIISPCALGAVFDEKSIPRIQAKIIAGGANNQLRTDADGARLAEVGILYAPDYVINGGGIINVACEYYGDVDDDGVMELVTAIGPRLAGIFDEAASSGEPTNVIADRQARKIIAEAAQAGSG